MSLDLHSDTFQVNNTTNGEFKSGGGFEKTSFNQIAGLTNKRKLKNLVKQ